MIKTPETTEQLGTPESTEQLGTPETTEQLGTPETTEQLGTPETTEQLGTPETTEQLGTPETTEQLGTPESTEQLGTPESTEQLGTPESTEQLETPETTELINPIKQSNKQSNKQSSKKCNLKIVHIKGNKDYFNSKMAISKFKQAVKLNGQFDLSKLSKKYVKEGHQLVLVNSSESVYKFDIKINSPQPDNLEDKKRHDLLKSKINNMKQTRTNSNYHKAKYSSNVPDEILSEYKKLIKISKMPIPEPSEILDNPDQYKPIISMVLGNSMMKSMPKNHPYIKYFKLIAKEIGAEETLPIPTENFIDDKITQLPLNLEQMMSMAGPVTDIVTDIKGEDMSKDADADTDSEEE